MSEVSLLTSATIQRVLRRMLASASIVLLGATVVCAQQTELKVGDTAPEIVLPDTNGVDVQLSSLRGKVVLIDFWATWCAPCVTEQQLLSKLHNRYAHADAKNAKAFAIYGVSLDSKRVNWVRGIKKLRIHWPQVSDLKYWSSQIAKVYGIQELPFNVLIDENGVIVAIDLHGKELESRIQSMVSGQ